MPTAALIYDFDNTLTPRCMQEYGLLEELCAEPGDFWEECRQFALRHSADGILSYMAVTLAHARKRGLKLSRDQFIRLGSSIDFYPGVETWFQRTNAYAASRGLLLEHYIISSGLTELIEGSRIAKEFKAVFAASFCYNDEGDPFWPATAVNYTAKTQYLFRINKGILDITNDYDLNDFTPAEKRRVPFGNMVYIGDGLTDVPCMKMTKQKGGTAIAVYDEGKEEFAHGLLLQKRAHYALHADYTEQGDLWPVVCGLLDDIAEREAERG